jgi:hypothetical protein
MYLEAWDPALRGLASGSSPEAVAASVGVPVELVVRWHEEQVAAWEGFGYPTDVARARVRSISLRPRSDETKQTFDDLVRRTFVPILKTAGYRKKQHNWTRPGDPVSVVVYLSRKNSDGDLLEFTAGYAIRVAGYWEAAHPGWPGDGPRAGVVDDGISTFIDDEEADITWSIQCGLLAENRWTRQGPHVTDDRDTIERHITDGLHGMLAFLESMTTLDSVISLCEKNPRDPRVMQAEVPVLRALRDAMR